MLALKNVLFTLVVPGTIAVYVPWLLVAGRPIASGIALALAIALFSLGAATYAWCVWDFAAFGRGTPLPIDAPKRLVVRGLYRYTRNPMYVGVLAVVLAWAVLFGSPALLAYAIALGGAFHLFVVLYEERRLDALFGVEYARYRAEVGRWLPRRRRDDGRPAPE
jgi:protein-S-isoprenylcysteine O-methyltransferase Ste14